jgi:archaellum component FlaC
VEVSGMAFNLKDIEAKLNSFSDKMNEIGNQVSDALNSVKLLRHFFL